MKEITKEKLENSEFVLSLKQTSKLVLLQWKTIFSSPILLFMIFAFPIILVCGVGALIPVRSLFAASFSLVMLLVIGIVYGNLKYSIDTSTFKSNSRLIVINEIQTVFSITITTMLVSFVAFNLELLIVVLFESNNFLFMSGFVFQGDTSWSSQDVVWKSISWTGVYNFYFISFLLFLSTYYFADSFFKSYRTFSIFVLIWLIINLLFGGVMNSIWTIYDPNTKEFISNNRLSNNYRDVPYEEAINWGNGSFNAKSWMSYIPILVPQWFNNQHYFYVFGSGAQYTGESFQTISGLTNNLPSHMDMFYWSNTDSFWNFTLLAPFVYSVCFLLFGLLVKYKN